MRSLGSAETYDATIRALLDAGFFAEGMVRPEGLEPPAYWFEASRSIQLSYGRVEESDYSNARDAAERYGRIRVCVGRFSGA